MNKQDEDASKVLEALAGLIKGACDEGLGVEETHAIAELVNAYTNLLTEFKKH